LVISQVLELLVPNLSLNAGIGVISSLRIVRILRITRLTLGFERRKAAS